ncbi:hypothetical protein AB0269_02735 [Microbacterium sp. NPDC077644]|uniref:hypothetical protein n=1 Tax=Microbacterium sp. NPDC077644 TaxID=3155055 RepID=UPI00344F4641
MTESERPEYVWAYPEQKPSRRKLWLIIGLSAAAVAIAVAVLFLFVLPSIGREPEPTASPTASPSPSETPTPSPTPTPTSSPKPTATPRPTTTATPPPAPEPDTASFRAEVQPRLDDAVRGLDLVTQNMDLGAQIVDSLQNDAAALSDTPAPSSLAGEWSEAVSRYGARLDDLRATYDEGTGTAASLDAAKAALRDLRAVVGL